VSMGLISVALLKILKNISLRLKFKSLPIYFSYCIEIYKRFLYGLSTGNRTIYGPFIVLLHVKK
jgi:hypothetical protein